MMSQNPESQGTCLFCGDTFAKRSASRHLEKCPKRQEMILGVQSGVHSDEKIWHLRIQSADSKEHWLDLEMNGSATLDKLDRYLRAIWLECCGHLSQFTIGGWGGTVIGKARKADSVFGAGMVLLHQYDFGTTSEVDIKAIGFRVGHPLTKHPIFLMARNCPPEFLCQECGQPANWLCIECIYEDDKPGLLCDEHAQGHPHENYGEPLPVVNSPRMGMCGYEGPATPPY